MTSPSYSARLAEQARQFKKWQPPRYLRDLYLFKYHEIKQAIVRAQRMHRGTVKGAVMTGVGLGLGRHLFKYGAAVKDTVDSIYEEYNLELPDDF